MLHVYLLLYVKEVPTIQSILKPVKFLCSQVLQKTHLTWKSYETNRKHNSQDNKTVMHSN